MTLLAYDRLPIHGAEVDEGGGGEEFEQQFRLWWGTGIFPCSIEDSGFGSGSARYEWRIGNGLMTKSTIIPATTEDYFWVRWRVREVTAIDTSSDVYFIYTIEDPDAITAENTCYGISLVMDMNGGFVGVDLYEMDDHDSATGEGSLAQWRPGLPFPTEFLMEVRFRRTETGGKKPVEVWIDGVKEIDYDGTANPDVVTSKHAMGSIIDGGDKGTSLVIAATEYLVNDEDGGAGDFTGRMGSTVDQIAYQPNADVIGFKGWTPSHENDGHKHYCMVDDYQDDDDGGGSDEVMDDELSTTTDDAEELFQTPDMGEADAPYAVCVESHIPGNPAQQEISVHVDGENRAYYPSTPVMLELTPDGNPWTKARVDNLFIGLRADIATSTAAFCFGAVVIGNPVSQPDDNGTTENADVPAPEEPVPEGGRRRWPGGVF